MRNRRWCAVAAAIATAGLALSTPTTAQAAPADSKPMLLVHGTADTVVRPYNSQKLADRLRRLGAPVDLRLYPGKSHVDTVKSLSPLFRGSTPALADSVAFLARHLVL